MQQRVKYNDSIDERLTSDNSESDIGSSNVSDEEIVGSSGSDDEANNQEIPDDEESKDTDNANDMSTSDEKSSDDDSHSPLTKKRKTSEKFGSGLIKILKIQVNCLQMFLFQREM